VPACADGGLNLVRAEAGAVRERHGKTSAAVGAVPVLPAVVPTTRVMTRRDKRADREALTPEQVAALKEFDQAVNAASDKEVSGLIVPAVLGPRYGGGLRLRGCSRQQLQALMDLKKAHERALARHAHAVRVCRHFLQSQ
jgi:hypothetical protein